ncbi:MAG: hypothetical protein OJF47_001506 [Nitrospira sp.]|nr:MAG: hypothetical protein OJF47_001506 [Nitrospira sp.]
MAIGIPILSNENRLVFYGIENDFRIVSLTSCTGASRKQNSLNIVK